MMINCETCAKRKHCFVKEFNVEQCEDYIPKGSVSMIKDSGTRREFETGAVRDIQEGKGRCDLLPLDVIGELYFKHAKNGVEDAYVFELVHDFQATGEVDGLVAAVAMFGMKKYPDCKTMLLEVSKHFEEGAKKYGEYNWQKGIPTHCYIDSAVRHYLKYLRGDTDEPHDRAFVWNILCCIWTCIHKPELNDYCVDEKLTNEDSCDKITITG